jgi:hypothetical protein
MKKYFGKRAATAALVVVGLAGLPAMALAGPSGAKAGFLTCNTASGWRFVFGSSRSVECEYTPTSGPTERYTGSITKFGVDIGYLSSAVMVWGVLAPSTTLAPNSLAGTYAGVTGSAAFGAGVGANVLVGGSGGHFMLQPVSIEGQTGLNIAAGVAALSLDAVQ